MNNSVIYIVTIIVLGITLATFCICYYNRVLEEDDDDDDEYTSLDTALIV
jgi:hypothetical protein